MGKNKFQSFHLDNNLSQLRDGFSKIHFRNLRYCGGNPDLRLSWVNRNILVFHIYLCPKIFTVSSTLISMIRTGIAGQLGGPCLFRRSGHLSRLPLWPGSICWRWRLCFGKGCFGQASGLATAAAGKNCTSQFETVFRLNFANPMGSKA